MRKLLVFAAILAAFWTGASAGEAMKIKMTFPGGEARAELAENATARAFVAKLPLELNMQDLYGRELCYRFGAGVLPQATTTDAGYEVGDIIYWPPRGSFAILYAQNGERFERVHLGRVVSGLDALSKAGDVKIKFELIT